LLFEEIYFLNFNQVCHAGETKRKVMSKGGKHQTKKKDEQKKTKPDGNT